MGSLHFAMISSGSRGNSTLIWDEADMIIIDFGITLRKLTNRLKEMNLEMAEASLFISHEHTDHSRGIPYLSRHCPVEIYSREATLSALGIRDGYEIKEKTAIGNFSITSVPVSHDAADPVGYVLKWRGRKITVVSDLGVVSERLLEEASGSDILAFEANHDVDMLKNGSYPLHLQRRILGRHGHLSNDQSAEAISQIASSGTHIVLTHLSKENNTPEKATETVKSYLDNREIAYASLECATQEHGTPVYCLKAD
ncbi:MAG: MBL fold metallo-hydrolase [Thermoplasmataceae archaeon]